MRTNYLLIDLENVKAENLDRVPRGQFKLKVFLGAHQKNIPLPMAKAVQSFNDDAEYIQIEGQGKNALDFHIAYYIGRLAVQDPGAFFHIISADTGFDPLIRHLKAGKILCQRSTSIETIPLVRAMNSKSLPDRVAAFTDFLRNMTAGRPRTVKTLGSTINTKFGGQVSEDDIAKMIEALRKNGSISLQDTKVSYHLDP